MTNIPTASFMYDTTELTAIIDEIGDLACSLAQPETETTKFFRRYTRSRYLKIFSFECPSFSDRDTVLG